jgi:hypothetical protein
MTSPIDDILNCHLELIYLENLKYIHNIFFFAEN